MRFLICCLILFVDLTTVAGKTCGEDEYKVSLVVSTRFLQESVVGRAYTYREKKTSENVRSCLAFKKKFEAITEDVLSVSASVAIADFVESDAFNVRMGEISFNEDFLGIFQEVFIKMSIDDETATKTETKFVKPVPVTKPWPSEKLKEEAEAYMDWYFPEGSKRNTHTETVCIKKGKIMLGLSSA